MHRTGELVVRQSQVKLKECLLQRKQRLFQESATFGDASTVLLVQEQAFHVVEVERICLQSRVHRVHDVCLLNIYRHADVYVGEVFQRDFPSFENEAANLNVRAVMQDR